MELKELIFKELVKNGYFQHKDGRKVWEAANRSFLYATIELAKSFLRLENHPRYKKTVIDSETNLLKENTKKFTEELKNENYNLIKVGCGNGEKTKVFLKELSGKGKLRFWPVNTNEYLVNIAVEKIKKAKFENIVEYHPQIACFESLNEIAKKAKNNKYKKNLILLLDSILASYEIHSYLFNLAQAMSKGDRLIIGNGIRVGERFANLENYNHPLFNEWMINIVKELGFSENEVEFGARFANSRVEIFYTIKEDKKLSHKNMKIEFKNGDEIIVGILYKYYEKELEEFCKMYFREVELVKDEDSEYALVLCKK